MTADSLRDRTRRAVQAELIEVAQSLIVARGYENVTVEQIATTAGLSRRSFFRYFPSKDALVIGKYELFGEQLVAAFAARPESEPAWTSLRRMFDPIAEHFSDPARRAHADSVQRAILASASLHSGFLQAQEPIKARVTALLAERGGARIAHVQLAAIVGSAFACYQAAVTAMATDGTASFDEAMDAAWAALEVRAR